MRKEFYELPDSWIRLSEVDFVSFYQIQDPTGPRLTFTITFNSGQTRIIDDVSLDDASKFKDALFGYKFS